MYDRFNLNYKAWYMTNQKYNNDTDQKFCWTLARPVNNMAIVLLQYSFLMFEQLYDNRNLYAIVVVGYFEAPFGHAYD